jgi:hypothetical protein
MRLSCILFAAVATLIAAFSGVSATSLQPVMNENPSARRLRSVDHQERRLLKKLPKTVVKDMLAREKTRLDAFGAWNGRVSVDDLAKSLGLSTNRLKWVKQIKNKSKKDQVALLKQYRAFLGQ